MTRIRYKKITKGIMVSQTFLCDKTFVKIELNLDSLIYFIKTDSGEILKDGKANTLSSLKKKSKIAAIQLGASFFQEIRNRGKTERFEI